MNKEIKEVATILSWNAEECKDNCEECKYDNDELPCLAVLQAKALYNAGYRKTVWHKVAAGDLPKEDMEVFCYDGQDYVFGTLTFVDFFNEKLWDLRNSEYYEEINKVIVWTELPKYEGEEQ